MRTKEKKLGGDVGPGVQEQERESHAVGIVRDQEHSGGGIQFLELILKFKNCLTELAYG